MAPPSNRTGFSLSSWISSGALSIEKFIRTALPFHASAWNAVSAPIQRLIESDDLAERERLTTLWYSTTQSHLQFVSVTSALVCAVVASSFTWPALSDLPVSIQSTVLAIWYNSLLLSLITIACATQQGVALSRLYSHIDRVDKIRNFLGRLENHAWKPRKLQLYIWQVPVTLLNASIYSFIIGTSVLVYGSASVLWSMHDIKIVVVFSSTLGFCVMVYAITAVGLYDRMGKS